MSVFIKQPREVLDYDIDLSRFLADLPGDDIQSVEILVESDESPSTLVIGPVPHPQYELVGDTPTRFKVWIGGGTVYVDYKVSCVVKTEQDRTKEVDFRIRVRDK